MKKKLMMVAVLLGALSLGACVDDNESASVTAVRDAKAEQLSALAEKAKAEAEAALINANAQKAIKEAEAAYQQAMAEAQKLANELQEIEIQKAKATLEIEIEAAKLSAEAALQSAKAALERAKADLIAALDAVDAAEKQRIQELVDAADGVLGLLQDARDAKLTSTALIAKLKAELVGTKEYVANQTKIYEGQIANQNALIAEYTKYEATIKTKEEAEKAYKEADAVRIGLGNVFDEKRVAYTEAGNVLSSKLSEQGQYEFYQKLIADYWLYFKAVDIFDDGDEDAFYHTIDYTFEDKTVLSLSYRVPVANYELDIEAVADAKEAKAEDIERQEGYLPYWENQVAVKTLAVTEAEKALADKKATDEYKNAVKAVEDAQKAYDAATTAADKENLYWALQGAKQTLKNVTLTEEQALADANEDKAEAEENVASIKEQIQTLKDELAELAGIEAFAAGDAAKAYAEYTVAYKKAFEAYHVDAYLARENASRAYNKQITLVNSLWSIANSYADYESLISNCKRQISYYEGLIAELNDVATKEEAIKKEEEKLAKAETDIAIYEAQYKEYMDKIQSLIKSETPAE